MQSCILCLEEGANLKQLNHCGVYYIHKQCHSKWISKNNIIKSIKFYGNCEYSQYLKNLIK